MSHQLLPPDAPVRCFQCHHPLPALDLPPQFTPPDPRVFAQTELVTGLAVDPVTPIDPTPEPSTLLLLGTVLVGVGWWLRWRRA